MKTIMAANWKMNKTRSQGEALASEVAAGLEKRPEGRDVLIFPPATALNIVSQSSMGRLRATFPVRMAAQSRVSIVCRHSSKIFRVSRSSASRRARSRQS